MKFLRFAGLLGLVWALVVACQANWEPHSVGAYQRDLGTVHQVSFGALGELVLTQGDRDQLRIASPSHRLKDIDIGIQDGVLLILQEEAPPTSAPPLQFQLTVRELDRVELLGIGTISVMDLDADVLRVDVSGPGTVDIDDLTAEQLVVNGSGAGRIEISGQVTLQQVSLSGAGQYLASGLQSQSATIDLSGMGKAMIWATRQLAINLSGAGSIEYYGTANVSRDISGHGSVDFLGQNPT
jgi:hypothetical protein